LKKHLPLIVLIMVVVLVVGGYLGFSSLTKEKTPPVVRDVKVPPPKIEGDDKSSAEGSKTGLKGNQVSSEAIKESNIPAMDPKAGEMMVSGEIKAVDVDKRVLTIDQQMDDNSIKISPNVPVSKDAIIRTKEAPISLAQVKSGDSVGIIVTKDGQARAVLVNY